MNKKLLITSLIIGSSFSILPLNFIFNNNNQKEQKIENENTNDKEEITNILNLDTKDSYVDSLYGKDYATLFINNFTNPVVSPNINIPGFLGAWDNHTIGTFPNIIGWTTPNLFLSWSSYLMDHPSLEGQVPVGFQPGLVTALHSDNKYSSTQRNQVFAIVANTSNLAAREYWILRYNTLDGTPIKDDNAKMPKMTNAPLPEMSLENGNGSAFSLTNDALNNRYLAFYPGRLGDLKNDIFGFQLNNENKIEWLDNKTHFSGHSNWTSMPKPFDQDYLDNNIVIGLSPFNTKKNPVDGTSIALMVAVNSELENYNFKILNLHDNFAGSEGFKPITIIGQTSGVFNTTKGTIAIPKKLLPLVSSVQRNINPNLQLYSFVDNFGIETYKAQMVFPVLNENKWTYVYLSSIFNYDINSYNVQIGVDGSALSQGSFFSSPAITENVMPPNFSYNDANPQEIIVTFNNKTSDEKNFTVREYVFNTIPPNATWDPSHKDLSNVNQIDNSNNWKQKNIAIKLPYDQNVFIWSLPKGQTYMFLRFGIGYITVASLRELGSIQHESFQTAASSLGWLKNEINSKLPSEITNAELQKIGFGDDNFFRIPILSYLNNFDNTIKLELFGEPIRDDKNGTIQGIFDFTQTFKRSSSTYNFKSKIPFEVKGLSFHNISTYIYGKDSISSILSSDLTPDNLPSFIDIVNAPAEALKSNWSVKNRNNALGTALVSVDVIPHIDDNGNLTNSSKTISANISGLRKLRGTSANIANKNTENLTVWDVNSTNAKTFVEIKDLIPGSSSNSIIYEPKNHSPLDGKLTITVSIPSGSYYDSSNKGLPSIVGGTPLQFNIPFTGFKTIPNTGTLVIPGIGPFPEMNASSINESNISNYFTIENQVPGSKFTFPKITAHNSSENEGIVTFQIAFDKEYDTNGFIIENPKPKEYVIKGFEIVPPSNNLIPIIAGSVSGGIFLIILIILLIILLRNRKYNNSKSVSKNNYANPNQRIVPPTISNQTIKNNYANPNSRIVTPPIRDQTIKNNYANPNSRIVPPPPSNQTIKTNYANPNSRIVTPPLNNQTIKTNTDPRIVSQFPKPSQVNPKDLRESKFEKIPSNPYKN
ncbi:MAG: hypothetical protein ACRC8C_01890 [Mycoplasmoidaceae bacterium]